MYKVLLGHMEPPDDVIPDFMHEELSGVGNAAQQAMERGRFLRVRLQCCPQHWVGLGCGLAGKTYMGQTVH